jgi:hypothetical protein
LPNNPKEESIGGLRASPRLRILAQLDARRIEFMTTAVVCVVFAICFAHLEHYYIKDPALQISNGKVSSMEMDRSREVKPIIGNTYVSHAFYFYSN